MACANGEIKIYNIEEGKVIYFGNCSNTIGFPATSFRWLHNNNNHFIACSCDGTIKWFDKTE